MTRSQACGSPPALAQMAGQRAHMRSSQSISVYESAPGQFDIGHAAGRGRIATMHGFDITAQGIVTRLINHHYWPSDVTDECIRAAVAAHRAKRTP
jgi:hypothetical protein